MLITSAKMKMLIGETDGGFSMCEFRVAFLNHGRSTFIVSHVSGVRAVIGQIKFRTGSRP